MLSLRPHQQQCHDAVLRSHQNGEDIISFQMATGSGKTRVLLVLPSSLNHACVIYVFPILGLISQFKDDYLDEFTHIFPEYVEASSNSSLTDYDLKKVLSGKTFCVITTYDSLPKVLQLATHVDCIIFDEAHHDKAPTCRQCMTENKEKIKCVIRASATLNESDTPCFTYPFHQAVKDGVCRDYSTYCFIKKKGSEHELITYLEEHRKQTGNSKVMVFTAFTESEKEGTTNVRQFVDKYRDSVEKLGGWIQGVVSSQSQTKRKNILKTFESNDDDQLSIVVSCRTIGEGVDTKKANVVVFVDPIRSTGMIIQRIGRGTRVYRDKDGVPLPVQRDGSVIVGIYIDPAKYEGKTEEEIDLLLKENMSKDGDFSAIFCVLAALRETDPDTYYQCIHFFEHQKTNNCIKEQGMDRIEVPRDGNCFFHCIGLQTGETHEQVRQRVVDYMEEHSENYEEFLSDEDNVEALREEGEWNNDSMDVMVRAAADMLGQTIRVHRPDGRIDEIGEGKEQIDVLLEDNHYTFLTHNDKAYNEEVEEKRMQVKSNSPKKKLFIDIDPDFKIMWKVKGDLVNDFTARIDAEIENDGLTMEDRWKINYEKMCTFIKASDVDITKRNHQSQASKHKDEQKIGSWVSAQKEKYNENGPQQSKKIMKTSEIWTIWNETLNNPEYMYALLDYDGQWKINYEKMCTFIKASDEDPKKRKRPSEVSNNEDEKKSGNWVSHQKKNYNENGHKHSIYSMKTPEIWTIWNETLNNPEYMYALSDFDYIKQWKIKYKQMCTFIKASDVDITKRKRPSQESEDKDIKKLGQWIQTQKSNYDSKGPTDSKKAMKTLEIWTIWNKTLVDPEYMYALQNKNEQPHQQKTQPHPHPHPHPQPQEQPQEDKCTSIFKTGVNKGKACGKKNCGVHKTQVQKPMTHTLPNPQSQSPANPPSEQPHASRPQCELSRLHKEYKTLRSNNLATKFREKPQLWHDYHRIAEANEATFTDGEVPYQRVIAWLNKHLTTFHPKKQKTIVDMGCGTARVHRAFIDRPNLTFHNLDHVACDDRVTVADIAHTGLEDGEADIVILCLAMWGSNKEDYLKEAFRILDPNGRLIIVEPSKRWRDESGQNKLRDMLERHGFTIVQEEVMTEDQQVHKFSLFVVKK